jgi:hypothetical protein
MPTVEQMCARPRKINSKKCELLTLYMKRFFANFAVEIARKNLKNTPPTPKKRRLRVFQGASKVFFWKNGPFSEHRMALSSIIKSISSYCFLLRFSSDSVPTAVAPKPTHMKT